MNKHKSFAFSLIELLISLIAISCITAAFAPVISKKLATANISVGKTTAESSAEVDCNNFGNQCQLCTSSGCLKCDSGYYVAADQKCSVVPAGYYSQDNITIISCPRGHYCTGNSRTPSPCSAMTSNSSYQAINSNACTACPEGMYSDEGSAHCTLCSQKFNIGCSTCNNSSCISAYSGYYVKNPNAYPCSEAIQNCTLCSSSNICTFCSSGYYLKSGKCHICSDIQNCITCSPAASSCFGCVSGYSTSGETCAVIPASVAPSGCSALNASGNCTTCSAGYYLKSNVCHTCNSALLGCSLCSSSTACTKCMSSSYYLKSSKCHACAEAINNCLHCSSSTACTVCAAGSISRGACVIESSSSTGMDKGICTRGGILSVGWQIAGGPSTKTTCKNITGWINVSGLSELNRWLCCGTNVLQYASAMVTNMHTRQDDTTTFSVQVLCGSDGASASVRPRTNSVYYFYVSIPISLLEQISWETIYYAYGNYYACPPM